MAGLAKWAGGLVFGAALSQFPEYSQQYVQRMGGALAELQTVVADFDTSAKASGYTRDAALAAMTGTDFLSARQADMRRTFARFDRLQSDYSRLKDANAFQRLAYVARLRDTQIMRGTAKDFKPALPLTLEGAGVAGFGFLFGYGGLAGAGRMRRRKRKQVAA